MPRGSTPFEKWAQRLDSLDLAAEMAKAGSKAGRAIVPLLRDALSDADAPEAVVRGVRPFVEDSGAVQAVGVPANSRASAAAVDFEYGDAEQPPHGTFRAHNDVLADIASGYLAERVERAVRL